MSQCCRILVSRFVLTARVVAATLGIAVLCACGQQGALYLPTESAAANRATLPQTLLPKPDLKPVADPPSKRPE
jgi:predicted small lipoprotein YifL